MTMTSSKRKTVAVKSKTSRRRATAGQHDQQDLDHLGLLLDGMHLLVVALDRDGCVEYCNATFLELTGHEREQVVGQSWWNHFVPPRARAAAYGGNGSHLAGPNSSHNYPILTQSGQERIIAWNESVRRNGRGQLLGMISVGQDITELFSADQVKNEFISLVSHELRTPLTSIKGYSDLILAGDAGAITPEQKEYLGIVKTNADHLIAMINDLLDLSRVEAGRIELFPAIVALTPMLGDIIRSMRPQLESKRQKISADLPSAEVFISADRDRLSQILWNLLSNAHKYSPPGASIRLEAQKAQATWETSSNSKLIEQSAMLLAISVEDEGVGIPTGDQAKLFTKFFRIDNSLTREIGGTGLGLAIVKSFVELHGGRVWVSSPLDPETGRGAKFTFTIPLAQDAQAV